MTLVETYLDETEADFRAAMDALLTHVSVPPRRDWWHPYEIGGVYEWRGIRFRHFFCIAGSVEAWVWKSAVNGGQRRVLMLPSESCVLFGSPKMAGRGEQVPVSPNEVTPVRSAP